MHSWGIETTVVELVPSVPLLFPEFHPDAAALLASPRARIVVDDGRRFLDRTPERYDVIVVDPPPPPEAAGSSLLYSREFYAAARRRLAPGGILQAWIPGGEPAVVAAFALALRESFPHVRVFTSVEGWGLHLLASDAPLPERTAAQLAARLPPEAAVDLVAWGPHSSAAGQLGAVLAREIEMDWASLARLAAPLADDRPLNEYFLLRRLRRVLG
jgi:predicted membrane-bound spermidine synthase